MQDDINENLKQISTWKRIALILVFAVIIGVVRTLLWVVVLLQIASALLTGNANQHILDFGQKLAAYTYHILLFLTFNTDQAPFPFSEWTLTEEVSHNKDLEIKK